MNRTRNQKSTTPETETGNRKNLFLFRIISISIPILLVVLIEVILRLAGYGSDYELFIEGPENEAYWVMSDDASHKFFTDPRNATLGNREFFRKEKAEDTYRIFILGESTTIGFPYLHNGSFHRWLQYRLMFAFPEKHFEIINLSLTAVNSYTVRDFAREIVDYEPDAVLIYTGHNEYYGALGVGSTSYMGSNPKVVNFLIKMRKIRLYQVLNNTINSIRKNASGSGTEQDEGLMVRMPAVKEIPFGSRKYEQGIRQFEVNMEAAINYLSQEDIPVFLSNLVSNEKDLFPFISDDDDPLLSAGTCFSQAEEAYEKGEFRKAKELYVKAKEMDLLRFRAPEAINMKIAELAETYDGVYLVDSREEFEENSPHGIIGEETLLEHVHPNLYGYALLSNAFFEAMKEEEIIEGNWENAMSFSELLAEMPVTLLDSMYGDYVQKFMLNSWPFTTDPIPNESLVNRETSIDLIVHDLFFREIDWVNATNQLLHIYQDSGNRRGSLKIFEAFSLELPLMEVHKNAAAQTSQALNDIPRAIFYTGKAFRINPKLDYARLLSNLYLNEDDPRKAKKYLEFMLQKDGSQSNWPAIIEITNEIIDLKEAYAEGDVSFKTLNSIALNYARVGAVNASRKYLYFIFKKEPRNPDALRTYSLIRQIERQISKDN
jgi:tetratricopeptide (TPR) repeat protein